MRLHRFEGPGNLPTYVDLDRVVMIREMEQKLCSLYVEGYGWLDVFESMSNTAHFLTPQTDA